MADMPVVIKHCSCGAVCEVKLNVAHFWKHCPRCTIEVKRQNEARRRAMKRATSGFHGIGGAYHISKDVDESWGMNSSLTQDEIEALCKAGHIAPGTEFRFGDRAKRSTHKIVRDRKQLRLVPITR